MSRPGQHFDQTKIMWMSMMITLINNANDKEDHGNDDNDDDHDDVHDDDHDDDHEDDHGDDNDIEGKL